MLIIVLQVDRCYINFQKVIINSLVILIYCHVHVSDHPLFFHQFDQL